jgi:hypothetical protein
MTAIVQPAQRFTASGNPGDTAYDKAQAWLGDKRFAGFVPLHIAATGDAASLLLSGPEGGAIVFVKADKK